MKKVWITAIDHNEKNVGVLLNSVRDFGLEANGHFWEDNIKNVSWLAPFEKISDKDCSLWIITGTQKSFESESVRYGLALLLMKIHAVKGNGFPVFIVPEEGEIDIKKIPSVFGDAEIIPFGDPSLGAKIVAKANMPVQKVKVEYYLDIQANAGYGTWFETGPVKGEKWNGAVFGVNGGEITFHGTGTRGKLPEKSTLEYPLKGLKMQMGENEYNAWAVKNKLDTTQSYYIKVEDIPKDIIFGPFPEKDDISLFALNF